MRVLITGGTGLIGRAVARDLVIGGYEVVVLSRSPEKASEIPEGVRLQKWDGRTAEEWGELTDGAKAIVNLAGASIARLWTESGKRAIRPVPAFAVRLLLGEMSIILLEGQRAVPRRLLDLGFEFQFADVEQALRDLLVN